MKNLTQLAGTAIGTKFAPPYAIIFMADAGIPYSQALRCNGICTDNKKFDQRCNWKEAIVKGWLGRIYSKQ